MWGKRAQAERAAFLTALEAMQRVAEAQSRAYEAHAAVLAKQMDVLTGYLGLFKVAEPPQRRVWDDEQAWRREQEAIVAGVSGTRDPREQLEFVMQSME